MPVQGTIASMRERQERSEKVVGFGRPDSHRSSDEKDHKIKYSIPIPTGARRAGSFILFPAPVTGITWLHEYSKNFFI